MSAHLFRHPRSIRLRLVALTLATLIPAMVVGLWLVDLTYQLAREANQRRLEDTTRALSMVLDRELAQRASLIRALALSRMLDSAPNIPPATLRAFDEQARRSLTGLEGWLEVHSTSRTLINTRLPPGELPRPTPEAPRTALVDTAQILPLAENKPLGLQHAALVQPILRDGRAVLNLTLTMMPHEFQRIIDQQKFDPAWVGAIIDSAGRVVARHPGGAVHAGRYATDDLRAHLTRARDGLLHSRSLDGHDMTIFFSTSPQGWTYVTGMPREQFEGALPQDMRRLALGTFVLLSLAVLASLWVSRGIARPIDALRQRALDMQNGDRIPAEPTGVSELDEVGLAMARASDAIHGAQREMERRVDEAVSLTRQAQQRIAHTHRLEALGRLTGGVAHDVNNLLGVISNSAHLMKRKTQDPGLNASADVMLRAVTTGGRLTQHLLRFAGRHSVSPSVVRLDSFLPEAAELIRATLGRRITLDVSIDPDTPPVFVDASELELALINLALNARDAITDRGELALRAAPAKDGDCAGLPHPDCVVISMSDNGCGMPEEMAQRVFEPFFSTRDTQQASGLGLSQVYGFCQQSGGTARLRSTVGVGTTVEMVLPIHAADARRDEGSAAAPSPSLDGTRVLLVEDNEELRAVTAALLASFGCQVTGCATPQSALAVLDGQDPIDVVLTDVRMPGPLNGVAFARQVLARWPDMPIVLISGDRGDVDDTAGLPLVRKPCTPDTLMQALQRAITARVHGR